MPPMAACCQVAPCMHGEFRQLHAHNRECHSDNIVREVLPLEEVSVPSVLLLYIASSPSIPGRTSFQENQLLAASP